MRIAVLLILIASAAFSLAAETTELPATLLTVRGKLIKEEPFNDADSIAKKNKNGWYIYKGKFEVIDGQLKVTEQKEDGHHPDFQSNFNMKDPVMQIKFRTGDSKWLGLNIINKKVNEHVFRVIVRPDSFTLNRMAGMGATTKSTPIAQKRFNFDKEKWYTILVEMSGKEVCAQIPEANITIYGESEVLDVNKDKFEIISGGDAAWFDDLKIWDSTPNPKWAEIKATLPAPAAPPKKGN